MWTLLDVRKVNIQLFYLSSGSSFSEDHIYEDFEENEIRSEQLGFKKNHIVGNSAF